MNAQRKSQSRQAGVALPIVLILLIVMSLVALGAMRGTLMEERMASNQLDRGFAFQTAEAALRAGERRSQNVALGLESGQTEDELKPKACTAGLCGLPVSAATEVWLVDANWNTAPSVSSTMKIGDDGAKSLTVSSKYLVELLASNVPDKARRTGGGDLPGDGTGLFVKSIYRVTARSFDTNRGEVMLQSIYEVPKQ